MVEAEEFPCFFRDDGFQDSTDIYKQNVHNFPDPLIKDSTSMETKFNQTTNPIFTIVKVNIRKLAVKAQAIHLKSFFITQIRSNMPGIEHNIYFKKLVTNIMNEKQSYSRHHLDFFLHSSIEKYVFETLNLVEDAAERSNIVKMICNGVRVGDSGLKSIDTFFDFYNMNKVSKHFDASKKRGKWKQYRKIPLPELIQSVYHRMISKETISKRTNRTQQNRMKKLADSRALDLNKKVENFNS